MRERFALPHPSLRPPADSPPPGVCAPKRGPRLSLRVLSQAAPGQAMAEATACLGASDLLVCRESPESTEDLEVEVPAVPVRAGAGRSHDRGPGAGLCPWLVDANTAVSSVSVQTSRQMRTPVTGLGPALRASAKTLSPYVTF